MDEQFEKQIDEIAKNPDLSKNQKRHAAGKLLRETVERLKGAGKTVSEIGELTGLRASRVRELGSEIKEHETIWFPGIYGGRTDAEYTKTVDQVSEKELIALVQKRAQEDGEWAIENGFVGDNEDKMRKMMAWVSDETNILQCYNSVMKEQAEMSRFDDYEPRTVDYICRDLANGSKWVGGSRS